MHAGRQAGGKGEEAAQHSGVQGRRPVRDELRLFGLSRAAGRGRSECESCWREAAEGARCLGERKGWGLLGTRPGGLASTARATLRPAETCADEGHATGRCQGQ